MASIQKKKDSFIVQVRQICSLLLIVFLIRTFGFGLYQVPTGSMETTMLAGEHFFADKFSYLITRPKHGHIISFNSPLYAYSSNSIMRLFEEYVWGPTNLTKRIIALPGDNIQGKIEDGKPVIYRNGSKLEEPYLNKYPLIAVWKSDPKRLMKRAQGQAMSQNKFTPEEFEQYINNELHHNIVKRSYDPTATFYDQPFYRIDPMLLFKDAQGKPIIEYPGTIINESKLGTMPPTDKNYWDGSDVFNVTLGANQYWLMGDNRLNSGDSRMFGPVDGHLIHGRILFRIWSVDSNTDWLIFDLIKHPIDFWTRVRWSRFFQPVY